MEVEAFTWVLTGRGGGRVCQGGGGVCKWCLMGQPGGGSPVDRCLVDLNETSYECIIIRLL